MTSRWNRFDVEIAKQLSLERPLGTVELAKLLLGTRETTRENNDVHSLAKYIFRNKKHFTDDNEGIYNATESLDISNRNVKHLWVKNKEASLFVKNPDYVEAEVDELEKLLDGVTKLSFGKVPPPEGVAHFNPVAVLESAVRT